MVTERVGEQAAKGIDKRRRRNGTNQNRYRDAEGINQVPRRGETDKAATPNSRGHRQAAAPQRNRHNPQTPGRPRVGGKQRGVTRKVSNQLALRQVNGNGTM